MKINLLIIALFSFFLFSCASSRFESKFSPVYVTNTSKFEILPTNLMSGKLDGVQRMEASFGEQEFTADIYVISDAEQLSMTIMNEFGTTMAILFYDGANLDFDSAIFPKNLKAEYIVADFQFCLYNPEDLTGVLKKIGVDFEISEANETETFTETRTLSKNGKAISKITKIYEKSVESGKSLKSIRYENFLRGYSYNLIGVSE